MFSYQIYISKRFKICELCWYLPAKYKTMKYNDIYLHCSQLTSIKYVKVFLLFVLSWKKKSVVYCFNFYVYFPIFNVFACVIFHVLQNLHIILDVFWNISAKLLNYKWYLKIKFIILKIKKNQIEQYLTWKCIFKMLTYKKYKNC